MDFFEIFARFFANVLAFYYSFTHDYALSILLLTLTVMIAVLPLTLKATRSMIIMQKVGPELKKMQDKHKNDRQKLNEEMMAFYKENKINPLSGCLPMLLQAPIFLFLYQALHGLIDRNSAGESTPRYLNQDSVLYKDLVAAGGEMNSVGIDFAKKALQDHGSIIAGVPFFLLIIIMVSAMYWQQRQISSRTVAVDSPQANTMRQIQRIMPPLFGAFALTVPAALVLYWAFQNVIRVFQQWAMYRFDPKLRDSVEHARDDAKKHLGTTTKKGSPPKKASVPIGPSKTKSVNNTNKPKRKGR